MAVRGGPQTGRLPLGLHRRSDWQSSTHRDPRASAGLRACVSKIAAQVLRRYEPIPQSETGQYRRAAQHVAERTEQRP